RSGELVAVGRALPRLTATGQALALGLVSFDAAHVICRAVAQISDDDLAAAAEQEMLGAATIGLPGSRSAAEALARPTSPEAGDSPGERAAAEPGTDGNPGQAAPRPPR